jgi:hypothetical protein
MKRRTQLAKVPDPQGRLDVLLYRLADRWMERVEEDRGLVGLREHILPMVEEAIAESGLPAQVPQELVSLFKVWRMNQGRVE